MTNSGIKNILLVDDDETTLFYVGCVLDRFLAYKDIHLMYARNGEDAVNMVKSRNDISMVLMDIQLPVMDGYEATKKIKEYAPKTVVIAQTARCMMTEIMDCLMVGCSGYLSKPYSPDDVCRIVETYLK